jgi:FkbM family methyltransferase
LVGPAGKVVAFEPLPENADYIRFHLKLNSITWCEVVEEAVGASAGVAAFSYDVPGSSVGHLGASDTSGRTISVRVGTLDGAASRFGSPNFIKMDIEGAETEALKGAPELLKLKAGWLIELHGPPPEKGVKALLGAAGYSFHTVGGKRLDASAVLPRHVLARTEGD